MEEEPVIQSARTVIGFYRQIAPRLAEAHGLTYPADLDRILTEHLESAIGSRRERL